MLEIKNMSCGYAGNKVIKDISLSLRAGEKLCILGPNGCGKTTLLRAVSGIIPYHGSACIYNKEIRSYSRRELSKKVAMFSQLSEVCFNYSVYDTVAMGRYLSDFGSASSDAIVMKCIERMGLKDIAQKPVTELSGGQLQRTLLARAFVQEPKLLILDEPTNHLDISYQIALVDLINQWVSEDDSRAVIGVVHELSLIPRLFDRVILLDEGKIVVTGEASQVLKCGDLGRVYNSDILKYMRESAEFWQ